MSLSRALFLAASFAVAGPAVAEPLEYYLPTDADYDATVPAPAAVIGHEIGEWHLSHDRLVQYMRALAETSDRVQWQETGRTYEGRPLLLLAISSPQNLARLEDIRERHLALSDPRADAPALDGMPAVVWMGFSVHGNEPSGANAAPVIAYHLAAAQDDWTRELLDNTVILFDPSVNPDGLQRFSTWANMHRGMTLVADRQNREHNEGWPNGRTNHYWFDLNRDWLLLTHPSSRARIAAFQRWRPNVLTDHHEMGTDQTFFFQPGIESRQNPLFPARTYELTKEIAAYHAQALDEIGSLYYSRESFDDFYLGKGSTYPDIQGAIGILFEQASSRGHLQDSVNGEVSFPFTIRNQVTAAFSTLRAVLAKRTELLAWQRDFYAAALRDGTDDAARGWVFGDDGDPVRAARLVEILRAHRVEVHPLADTVAVDGREYAPGHAWVVPAAQAQYRLARGMLETRTEFADNTFYDVSTWTLPHAFGLPYAPLGRRYSDRLLGDDGPTAVPALPAGDALAYAFEWNSYFAPRAAHRLLAAGARVRVATKPFSADIGGDRRTFAQGTIVVPLGIQDDGKRAAIEQALREGLAKDGITVHALATGFAPAGIDLGSPSMRPLELPRVAIIVGDGVSPYEAGEAWHLLDERFGMPITLLERDAVARADLDRYTHLVMVDGRYDDLDGARIGDWVKAGGTLVASKGAAQWAAEQGLVELAFDARDDGDGDAGDDVDATPADRRDYARHRGDEDAKLLSGAIFETDLDVTHPLAWGIPRRSLPVFRDSAVVMQRPENAYATVAAYTAEPLLSGYSSDDNARALAGTAAVVALPAGRGMVVATADNLNFRGFWYGTNRVFMNALYFSEMIRY